MTTDLAQMNSLSCEISDASLARSAKEQLRTQRGELVRSIVDEGGLRAFAELFFPIVEPNTEFLPGFHIDAICEHLEAVTRGEITKLVINVPPGHMKSLLVNVMWPAWEWAFNPWTRWMHASCDVNLMLRDARKTIDILRSDFYRAAWPDFALRDTTPAVSDFRNRHGGHRFSTSPKGKSIGHHFHRQVGDDLVKPVGAAAKNPVALQEANDWWSGTASTRRLPGLARLLIMQRLAENDPAGVCLREEGYEHLCLEFEYAPNKTWDFGSSITRKKKLDLRTEPGQILWPERYGPAETEELKTALKTPTNIDSQLQQNPKPVSGAFIEPGWIQEFDLIPDLAGAYIIQSWDFSHKGTQEAHSRVHGALWALLVQRKRYLLLDEYHKLVKYPEAKKAFLDLQKKPLWSRSNRILIEGKASGVTLIQDVEEMAPTHVFNRIQEVTPIEDKIIRFIVHSDKFEMKEVWVASSDILPTSQDFQNEIEKFPMLGTDRGDTTSQAFDHFDQLFGRFEGATEGLAATK